jgi:very-short-patch-repair endonuclease
MPHRQIPGANRRLAKVMRRSMTEAEFRLWLRLRKPGIEGLRFRRQVPIGPYIVDFCCPAKQFVVEVDGDHHGRPATEARDARRDAWLKAAGYTVLRFGNREIGEDLEGVCDRILEELKRADAWRAAARMRQRAKARGGGRFDWDEWKSFRDEGRP